MRPSRPLAALLMAASLALATVLAAGCAAAPKVPDVVGMPAADAIRTLQDAGYKLGKNTKIYTPGATPGTVFEQSPVAGQPLKEGEAVDLRIALPLGEFSVPDVSGNTAADASATIASAQLTPKRLDQPSDTVAEGTVIGQVPAPGAKVNAGADVYFVVSSGKKPVKVKVPNVTGKSQADADKAISAADLKSKVEKVYSDSVEKGKVIGQTPPSGTSVSPGTVVTYALSLGKPAQPVTVPNVEGKSEADAKAAIQKAGLVVQVYKLASDTVAKGKVSAQMPPANTKTAKGGTIGIVVSTGPASGDGLVSVPDVSGMTQDEASASLGDAGFQVQATVQPSADVPEGSVIGQLPGVGSKAPAGSVVVIAVSGGTP
jgi:serine/threonine-protein kinase